MNGCFLTALFFGLLIGSVGGYTFGRSTSTNASSEEIESVQAEPTISQFDFEATVAWASDNRWTSDPYREKLPRFSPQFYSANVLTKAGFTISSLQYLSTTGPPLSEGEQTAFFNRFCGRLALSLGDDGSQPVERSALHRTAVKGGNIYHHQVEFYRVETSANGTNSDVRGTATVWMTANDNSTVLMLTLTEVAP